jgi:hypothetical protein
MGKSRFDRRHSRPQAATAEKNEKGSVNENIFVPPREAKPPARIADEELDEAFSARREENLPLDIHCPLTYEEDVSQEDYLEEEEDETDVPSCNMLAAGSSFEELEHTVRTVVHIDMATEGEQQKAGGVLLGIRRTDMFEQLVQSKPGREDIVGEVMQKHLTAHFLKKEAQEVLRENPAGRKAPADFDIRKFV